jgi:putative Holliday junction resolvase
MSTPSSPATTDPPGGPRASLPAIVMGAPYNGRMRVLGIDPGGKRFGMAVGDVTSGVVTPVAVVAYRGRTDAAATIADAAASHGAELVVIGLPTDVDGHETAACARSRALVAALAELGIEAELQPEVLSTDEARRRARSVGRRGDGPVDDLAAQVIVEEYLACRRRRSSPQ